MNATQLSNVLEVFDPSFPTMDDFTELSGKQLTSVFGDDCREKKINYETFRGIYFSYFPESIQDREEDGRPSNQGGLDYPDDEEEEDQENRDQEQEDNNNAKRAMEKLGLETINEPDEEDSPFDEDDGVAYDFDAD